jgi:hypothetical protein
MAISFHCESCKKKIKAPDATGGKWGNCPHCNHRCYIPLPHSADEEELKLAPLDENKDAQYGQLMRETHSLTQNILHQTEQPDDNNAKAPVPEEPDERELIKAVILYLKQMADGQLDEAQAIANQLAQFNEAVKEILVKMARAERPEPELADIPERVINKLIKNLNANLG